MPRAPDRAVHSRQSGTIDEAIRPRGAATFAISIQAESEETSVIDLSSDTQTRPTPAIREFMATAAVGDGELRKNTSVNRLQELAAALTGKEAALFSPLGHDVQRHRLLSERQPRRGRHPRLGSPSQSRGGRRTGLAGQRHAPPVRGPHRHLHRQQVLPLLDAGSTHSTPHSLHLGREHDQPRRRRNLALERLAEMRSLVDEHGMRLHMDGARLLNGVVASGIPASTFASYADSVWIDLSKGLGAPVGAVLAGTREFIERARRLKHMFGGAMRQAGIIAAGGIYALEHHVDRLAEDHANAQFLAEGLASIPGVSLVYDTVPTNIVFFDVSGAGLTAAQVERGVNSLGVRFGANWEGSSQIRAVTHLDVSRDDCARAVEAVREVCLEEGAAAEPGQRMRPAAAPVI